jgi:NifB/MoaA-like Fe-S oxidoreductase
VLVHGQVVVCPGVNDGVELERTLHDVVSLYPELASIALVPVGVSDFTNEASMREHTPEEARHVVALAESFQRLTREIFGTAKVFASDEFYIVAGIEPPGTESFESLDEAENGVGLVAAFKESFTERTSMAKLGSGFFQSVDGAPALGYRAPRTTEQRDYDGEDVTVLTGEYAAPILRALFDEQGFYDINVKAVKNRYFGGNIKVAGLMTGADLRSALEDIPDSTVCLVPDVCLSEGRFLDGLTLDDLPRPVMSVPTTGHDLRTALESVRSRKLSRA